MSDLTIYHNPRCSKSRATLTLLQDRGLEPTIVEYLSDTPSAATLKAILKKLGLRPIDVIRKKEKPFADLQLAAKADDDDALIAAMIAHPTLIERPIVVHGKKAAIGRPPENVEAIL